jgi:predicted phosphodiesterase
VTRIGLISDTHGFLDESIFDHFKNCDEVWHIGDFGNSKLADQLSSYWSDRDGQTSFKGV